MTTIDTINTKCYCNLLAMDKGLDPAGHAGSFKDAILIEAPLPWKSELYQTAGVLPQEMIDLLALWLKQYYEGQGYPHRPLLIAPDKDYSQDGMRRIMFYTREADAISGYNKVEYLVPFEKMGGLIWSLYEDRDSLAIYDRYRLLEQDTTRDILVCTHGTIDAACAKFGFPLYRHMRNSYADDNLRVWRVSHFGGHVFAPTLMDMPTGHYWAYVEEAQAEQIVKWRGDVGTMRGHYRGWSGLDDTFLQVAERDLWQEHGWQWFNYPKSGEIIEVDDAESPQWAVVRIKYIPSSGITASQEFRVETAQSIETPYSTNNPATYVYPQYRVEWL